MNKNMTDNESSNKVRQIIAILRGITPADSLAFASILAEEGITMIEVPLNSPDALESIRLMAKDSANTGAIIGAGTVLKINDVDKVKNAGGKFIVSPNCDRDIIKATKGWQGMKSYPGVMTPTEAFNALDWGADGLKLFPGELIKPAGLRALRAVLPKTAQCFAVGGVSADNFAEWRAAGADGFGIGSGLYKQGTTADTLRTNARAIVQAYDKVMTGEVMK